MKNETIYLTNDQAQDLVERIAKRCKNFNYEMSSNESQAMADLLFEIGVSVDDLLDVSRLADEYAINAEIVEANGTHEYRDGSLSDALFTWKDNNGDTCYCLSW